MLFAYFKKICSQAERTLAECRLPYLCKGKMSVLLNKNYDSDSLTAPWKAIG